MNKGIIIQMRIIKITDDKVTFEFPKCIRFDDKVKKCIISNISFDEGDIHG